LRSGELADMRLDWLGEVVNATGVNADPTAAVSGYGTDELEAYRLYCLGTDPRHELIDRLALLEQSVEADPNFTEAWLALADSLEEMTDTAGVREVLEELMARRPGLAEGHYRFALALRRDGEQVAARTQAERITEDDRSAHAHYLSGLVFTALEDPARALDRFATALEGGSTRWRLFAAQAECFFAMGQHRAAINSWQTALDVEPEATELLGPLALAHYRLGEAGQSELLFARAQEQCPNESSTHRALGTWLQDEGRHEEAIVTLSRAIELQPDDALLHNNRGFSRFEQGDLDGARKDFLAALERIHHGELPFYMHLNLARLDRGDHRLVEASRLLVDGGEAVRDERSFDAIASLQAAISIFPESWKSWLFLALAYRQQSQWTRVADALSEVLKLRPDHASALSEQALAMLALGDPGEALRCAEQASLLAPDDPGVLANLALVRMESGRFEAAREALLLATDLDPADPITERCWSRLRQLEGKNPTWSAHP
jgi:tetratricopeptide (TPR) repeat protein